MERDDILNMSWVENVINQRIVLFLSVYRTCKTGKHSRNNKNYSKQHDIHCINRQWQQLKIVVIVVMKWRTKERKSDKHINKTIKINKNNNNNRRKKTYETITDNWIEERDFSWFRTNDCVGMWSNRIID